MIGATILHCKAIVGRGQPGMMNKLDGEREREREREREKEREYNI